MWRKGFKDYKEAFGLTQAACGYEDVPVQVSLALCTTSTCQKLNELCAFKTDDLLSKAKGSLCFASWSHTRRSFWIPLRLGIGSMERMV